MDVFCDVDIEEGAFSEMLYLHQLWLNYNRLLRLPSPLPSSLQRLLVESNFIRELHSVFGGGSKLQTISLAGNIITEIKTDVMSRLPGLKVLDLSNNHLRRVFGLAFRSSAQLRSLQLSRNPIEYLNRYIHGRKTRETGGTTPNN